MVPVLLIFCFVECFIWSPTFLCSLCEFLIVIFYPFFLFLSSIPSICFFPVRFFLIFKWLNIFPFSSNIFSLLLLGLFSFSFFYFLCPDYSLPMSFISLALLVIIWMLQLTLPVLQSPSTLCCWIHFHSLCILGIRGFGQALQPISQR